MTYVGWPRVLPPSFLMQSITTKHWQITDLLCYAGQIRRDFRTNTASGYLQSRNSVVVECSICSLRWNILGSTETPGRPE